MVRLIDRPTFSAFDQECGASFICPIHQLALALHVHQRKALLASIFPLMNPSSLIMLVLTAFPRLLPPLPPQAPPTPQQSQHPWTPPLPF